jgi:hypothetical protein
MKKKTRRRIKKTVAWIVVIVLLLFTGLSLVTYYYGNSILKKYLVHIVETDSRGIYHARIDRLSISLLTGAIRLSGFRLIPDTAVYNRLKNTDTVSPLLFSAKLDRLLVHGLDFPAAILDKKIRIRRIDIVSPELTVIMNPSPVKTNDTSLTRRMLTIPLPGEITSISVKQIRVDRGKLTIIDRKNTPQDTFLLPGLKVTVSNFRIDPRNKYDRRIFNSDDIAVTVLGFKITTKDKMYILSAGEFNLSTGHSGGSISDLKVQPLFSREEFSRKLGYQSDRLEIKADRILFSGIDIRQLLLDRKILIRSVAIRQVTVSDYRDKRIPARKNFYPLLPQQALKKLNTCIRMDTITFSGGEITYEEQVGSEPGRLFFDRVSGTILNLTNDPERIKKQPVMTAEATLYLMGKGKLWGRLKFPLNSINDAFTFTGRLGSMDLREINPMLTRLAPAEITSGTITKLEIPPVTANPYTSRGSLNFYYTGLKFNLKTGDESGWGAFKNSVLNFAAGVYIISDNPRANGEFTQGIIYFERDRTKGIFSFLWKSVFSGVKSTFKVNTREQKEIKKARRKK